MSLERSDFSTDSELSVVGDGLLDSAEHPINAKVKKADINMLIFELFMIVIVPWRHQIV